MSPNQSTTRQHTRPLAGSRVSAGGASTFLQVEATPAAPDAQGVRLVSPLPEAAGTLTLKTVYIIHE